RLRRAEPAHLPRRPQGVRRHRARRPRPSSGPREHHDPRDRIVREAIRTHADSARLAVAPIARRVSGMDWPGISRAMDELGSSLTGPVLEAAECKALVELYGDDRRFRSTIDMARYRFGQGQYRYFDEPLPELVTDLRAAFWPHLLPIARTWAERLGRPAPWPDSLDEWLEQC